MEMNGVAHIDTLKLLGYNAIQYADGTLLAKRHSGERVLFSSSMEILDSGFDKTFQLSDGVCIVFKDTETKLLNTHCGDVEIALDYTDTEDLQYFYAAKHYIIYTIYLNIINVYDTKGKLVVTYNRELLSIVYSELYNKLVLYTCIGDEEQPYMWTVIDTNTATYSEHTLNFSEDTPTYELRYKLRYFGKGKVLFSRPDAICVYDLYTADIEILDGCTCDEYTEICNYNTSVFYNHIIYKDIDTSKYYLIEEDKAPVLIDTDMTPILYKEDMYIATKNNKQYILDHNFNVMSKGYDKVYMTEENKIVVIDNENTYTVDLKTKDEKLIRNKIHYSVFTAQKSIWVQPIDSEGAEYYDLNGEFLYTTHDLYNILDLE